MHMLQRSTCESNTVWYCWYHQLLQLVSAYRQVFRPFNPRTLCRWRARCGGQPLRVGGWLPAPLLSLHPQPTGCLFSCQAKCAHCTLPVCSLDPQSTEHFPQQLCWEPSGTSFHRKEPHSPSLMFLPIRIFGFLPFISLLTTRFLRHSEFNHNQTLVFVRPNNNVRPQCCLDNVRENKFLF